MDVTNHIYRYDLHRVNEEYKCHADVEALLKDDGKRKYADKFITAIWPLVKQEINGEQPSISEVSNICNAVFETLRLSATLFAQDVFRFSLVKREDQENDGYELPHYDDKELAKVEWWYAELANYLNAHPAEVTVETVQWAEWNWHYEFASRLITPKDVEGQILSMANADTIYANHRTLHLVEGAIPTEWLMSDQTSLNEKWNYIRRYSSYIELPSDLLFLVHHYEESELIEGISGLIQSIADPVLVDSLMFHLGYPSTFEALMDYTHNELTLLSLLEHWTRSTLVSQCNMEAIQAYSQEGDSKYDKTLLGKSVRTAQDWCKDFQKYVEKTMCRINSSLESRNLHLWYFGRNWTIQASESLQYRNEKQFRQYCKAYFVEKFSTADIMEDFPNRDYLAFVGCVCAEKHQFTTGDCLRVLKAYRNYLNNDSLFGKLELEENNLNFLRGLAFSITHIEGDLVQKAESVIDKYKVRNEGWNLTEDYIKGVVKEAIVLSAALLIYENDDYLPKDRNALLEKVLSSLIIQVRTCRHEYLQEYYQLPLQIAETILLQLHPEKTKEFEITMCRSISDLYILSSVLSLDENLDGEVVSILTSRWCEEYEGLKIIATQCRKSMAYNRLKEWVERLTI